MSEVDDIKKLVKEKDEKLMKLTSDFQMYRLVNIFSFKNDSQELEKFLEEDNA